MNNNSYSLWFPSEKRWFCINLTKIDLGQYLIGAASSGTYCYSAFLWTWPHSATMHRDLDNFWRSSEISDSLGNSHAIDTKSYIFAAPLVGKPKKIECWNPNKISHTQTVLWRLSAMPPGLPRPQYLRFRVEEIHLRLWIPTCTSLRSHGRTRVSFQTPHLTMRKLYWPPRPSLRSHRCFRLWTKIPIYPTSQAIHLFQKPRVWKRQQKRGKL